MKTTLTIMTAAMLASAAVAGPVAATNNTIPAPATHRDASDRDSLRWEALAMVESGGCDTKAGPSGEVGRWQMLPRYWAANTSLPLSASANPFTALAVAKQEQARRVSRFQHQHHRPPWDVEWFMLWHRPAVVLPLWETGWTHQYRDYATRCCNTLRELERKAGAAGASGGR